MSKKLSGKMRPARTRVEEKLQDAWHIVSTNRVSENDHALLEAIAKALAVLEED
jgi:hypothetical protein